jgi:hypothetical protein
MTPEDLQVTHRILFSSGTGWAARSSHARQAVHQRCAGTKLGRPRGFLKFGKRCGVGRASGAASRSVRAMLQITGAGRATAGPAIYPARLRRWTSYPPPAGTEGETLAGPQEVHHRSTGGQSLHVTASLWQSLLTRRPSTRLVRSVTTFSAVPGAGNASSLQPR